MMAWKLIDTAPRDRPVLVFDPVFMVRVARWQPRALTDILGVELANGLDGRWLTDLPYGAERGEVEAELAPTHWAEIPLPLPGAAS